MKDEKGTASGATNTEDGKENEFEPSISNLHLNVKCNTSLDLRTELFMLNVLRVSMNEEFLKTDDKCAVLNRVISKCTEANEA